MRCSRAFVVLFSFAFLLSVGTRAPCDALFFRGDTDSNGNLNISDAAAILRFLFPGREAAGLPCLDAADVDDNGQIEIADAIAILRWLFQGAQQPQLPETLCHHDLTTDSLDCQAFSACSEELESIARDADAVVYVIDRSGTMLDRGELTAAKNAAISAIRELREEGEFGVVFFDQSVQRFPPAGPPLRMVPEARFAAEQYVRSMPGGPGTCPRPGLITALEMLGASVATNKVIIFLSDGGATCPGDSEESNMRKTLEGVAERNTEGVKIHTAGVLDLTPQGEQFLKDLATHNGGTYRRVSR